MPPPPRRGRPRSFTPAELRGTLGTLLRNTLAQAGVVRDVLERGAREGRARLDDVRHERRRHDALATLGEIVLERLRRGELAELADDPEVADAIAEIEEYEAVEPPRRGRGRDDRGERDVEPGVDWIEPVSRSRFDRSDETRARDERDGEEPVSSRDWKPPRPRHPDQRVWRPTDATPAAPPPRTEPRKPAGPPRGRSAPAAAAPEPRKRGGIVFDAPDDDATSGDDDLSQYMNPDDVPRRDD